MNKELLDIFEPTAHLSAAEVEKYAKKKLVGDELHKAESHLIDCPLCTDAVDGALLLINQGKHSGIGFEVPSKPSREGFYWRAVAAILIVSLSVGGLLWWEKTNKQTEMALVKDEAVKKIDLAPSLDSTKPDLEEQEKSPITPSDLTLSQGMAIAESEQPVNIDADEEEDVPLTKTPKREIQDESVKKPVSENLTFDAKDNNLSDDAKFQPAQVGTKYAASADVALEDEQASKKAKQSITVEEVKNAPSSRSSAAAINLESVVVTGSATYKNETSAASNTVIYSYNPSPAEELNIGIENYKNKQYQDAIRLLDKAAQNSASKGLATYYLAQCYIKTSRWTKANKALQVIIDLNLSQKPNAQKTLDSLKALGH